MLRRYLFWALVVVFIWVLVARLTQVERLVETLARGQWEWVLAAIATQGLYYATNASLYHFAFAAIGVASRTRDLLPVWFASIFLNVIAPTAGPVIFIDDASLRGQSAARATAGTILVRIADFSTFGALLVGGLVYLAIRHDLRPYELLTALALLAIIAAWIGLLALARWRPAHLRRLLAWAQRQVNALATRFRRPPPLGNDWADQNAGQFTDAAHAIEQNPAGLWRTLAVALAVQLLSLATVWALFLAFHHPVRLGTLLAGFSIGLLFWIVSITPEGIGVVEGMMTLVFTSLGVPSETALVVVLAFRGLVFWLPLILGVFFLRRVRSFQASNSPHSPPAPP